MMGREHRFMLMLKGIMFEFLFKAAFKSCHNDCIWEMSAHEHHNIIIITSRILWIFYEHQISELGSCHLKKHGEY